MSQRIVVVGASAGGVAALEELVTELPADFPAPVLVALHMSREHPNLLPRILERAGVLPARTPASGEKLEAGMIYVAPPNQHLLVRDDEVLVASGPKENRHRPSIDLLFRSAAYYFGTRAVGVVLSGLLTDGSSGLFSIKRLGGVGVVQDPDDAPYRSMPTAAVQLADPDHVLPAAEMGALLARIVSEAPPPDRAGAESYRTTLRDEVLIAAGTPPRDTITMQTIHPSSYTCPDCTGVLYRVEEGTHDRFRCHTGHGYTAAALAAEYMDALEDSIWETVRRMQETVSLLDENGERAEAAGDQKYAHALQQNARNVRERLGTLRALALQRLGSGVPGGYTTSKDDADPT